MVNQKTSHKDTASESAIKTLLQNIAIRHKLVAIIMLTCVVALVVAGITFMTCQYISSRQAMVKTLQTQATMISDNCEAAITFGDTVDAEQILSAFQAQSSVLFACILKNDGSIFAKYQREGSTISPDMTQAINREQHLFTRDFLIVSKPIIGSSGNQTIGIFSVWSDLKPITLMFRRYLITTLAIIIFSSLVAYLISSRVQGIISNPVLQLADIAKTVSDQKEYSIRAHKESNDEFGVLIDSFNGMLTQIQKRDVALVNANKKLETRVEERTRELRKANKQLTLEIEYRIKVQASQRERTERIIRHQGTLLHLGKLCNSDLDQFLVVTTEELAKTLQVERVSVWFFEDTKKLTCQDLYTLSKRTHECGASFNTEDIPKYIQTIEASRIVATDHAEKDSRTSEFYESYLLPNNVHSIMDVPIRLHGKLVGLICHEHTDTVREWSLEEQDFAASVADMIMLKLETQERLKAQLALKESEHRYKTLLQNIPQKILYKDLNCRFMLCNESFASDLNIISDDIFGKTDFDFFDKAVAEKYIADDKRIMKAGVCEEIEELYIRNGKELTVQVLKSPVRDGDGNIIGIFCIFWDITARKEAEKNQIKLNRDLKATVTKLQRSNSELQEFAYVTAHDLKAPLRAIGTLTDWVYGDYKDVFNDQGREHMELVKGRVSRMNEIIDSILRYGEIGRVKHKAKTIDLDSLLPDALAFIHPPKHIKVEIITTLPTLTIERLYILQIFQNLINNAIKFMDKDEGSIQIACQEERNTWNFSIADNGPGIDTKYHEKIFKMFQTLVPRDELESTGIGLAVVKKIVEVYGGQVWVDSEVGQGSTFHFTLSKELTSYSQEIMEAVLSQ